MHGWWAASYLVLWLLVVVLSGVVVVLARQLGALHIRLGPQRAVELNDEGARLGEAPGASDLVDIAGSPVRLGGPGPQQLLLFVSPGCGICEQVLPALPSIARNGQLRPYVITDVDPTEAALAFGDRGVSAPVISGPELIFRYNVPGTPYVIVTDRLGIVRAKGPLTSLEQVEALVEEARRSALEVQTET